MRRGQQWSDRYTLLPLTDDHNYPLNRTRSNTFVIEWRRRRHRGETTSYHCEWRRKVVKMPPEENEHKRQTPQPLRKLPPARPHLPLLSPRRVGSCYCSPEEARGSYSSSSCQRLVNIPREFLSTDASVSATEFTCMFFYGTKYFTNFCVRPTYNIPPRCFCGFVEISPHQHRKNSTAGNITTGLT